MSRFLTNSSQERVPKLNRGAGFLGRSDGAVQVIPKIAANPSELVERALAILDMETQDIRTSEVTDTESG